MFSNFKQEYRIKKSLIYVFNIYLLYFICFNGAETDENKKKSSNQRKRQRAALTKLEELKEQKKIKKEARKKRSLEAMQSGKENKGTYIITTTRKFCLLFKILYLRSTTAIAEENS
jgi:hypothetical protein